MNWIGINTPFIGGNEGVFSIQTGTRIVKNDLLQLLMTVPGERVMRPTFGTPLRKYTFESMTEGSIEDLRNQILQAIDREERRVAVDNLVMEKNADNHFLAVKLYVHLVDDPDVAFMIETGIAIAA